MGEFLRKLQYYFRRRQFESELDEEMSHHAAMAGSAQFGNKTQLKEESRAAWGWTSLEQLAQDLRYAFRTMRTNRVFTALAVLSLALGIGANTAIYSVLDSILVRYLPVREPERLVRLEWRSRDYPDLIRSFQGDGYRDSAGRYASDVFPYTAFDLLGNDNQVFENLFVFINGGQPSVIVNGNADTALAFYASGGFFKGLGLRPAAGQFYTQADDRQGATPLAVLSFSYALRQFGEVHNAVGKSIVVSNLPYTVVGVAPPEFFGVNMARVPDMYLPLQHSGRQFNQPNEYWAQMMARLRPGVSLAQAESALAPRFHQFVESTARNEKEKVDVPALALMNGAGGVTELRQRYTKPLWILMTLVGLVLALACANIANLLLARAEARRREMAVRLSIGAGRWRVIRQLLTESVLMASLGGLIGVGFAVLGVQVLNGLLANGGVSNMVPAELNWRVLGLTAALALLTGLATGLAPALQAVRVDVMPVLKDAKIRRGYSGRRFLRFNMGQALVIAQVAMTLLLLVAAGLFARTLGNLRSLDLGFNKDNLLLFDVNPRQAGYSADAAATLHRQLREQLQRLPGVQSVGASTQTLLAGEISSQTMEIPGVAKEKTDNVYFMNVGPGFFETMRIPIREGRAIDERDIGRKPQAVVVNERLAKAFFPGQSAVGRIFSGIEIVGVAKDAQYGLLQEGIPVLMYRAMGPSPFRVAYSLRTAGDPLSYVGAARDILHKLDSRIPLVTPRTQASQIERTTYRERAFAQLCSGLALLALFIASIGLYATMDYGITRRINEIGIRMALGAQRSSLISMVLREAGWLAMLGLVIGVPVALATSKYVESFLFGMKPDDPATLMGAVAVLVAAMIAAVLAPAWRASRIDPMVALRHD